MNKQCALFLFSVFAAVSATVVSPETVFAKNASSSYVLKKSWVKNFIKFEYVFEEKTGKAKIVPVGCVPSNSDDGDVLKPGDEFREHDFVFACEEGEDGILNYEAIACVDAFGTTMHIGEVRKLSNGTVILHCNLFGGALKKIVERAAGCYYDESIYGEEDQWIEPFTTPNKNMSDVSSFMTGRVMECFRPHYSYYESHVIGCALGILGLKTGDYAKLFTGQFVQCVEKEAGTVTLVEVGVDELKCEKNETVHNHDESWLDHNKAAYLTCKFGMIIKTGCYLDGQKIPIGQELRINNGCIYLCHPQTNVYICDESQGNYTIVEPTNEVQGLLKIDVPKKL